VTSRLHDHATGLTAAQFDTLLDRLRSTQPRRRGRPWAHTLRHRVLVVCVSLRTNLTMREVGALCSMSKSQVHRIIADLTPRLGALLASPTAIDRRRTWVLDGTLVPTRDHSTAAKSKNYRWSCNAQVLVHAPDLQVVALAAGGPGNRNDTIHYRGSALESMCRSHPRVLADGGYRGIPELITPVFSNNRIVRDRKWRRHRRRRARVEHALARLKDWRVLRDHRRRGRHLNATFSAVAVLHNLKVQLRDSS
jgi:hypothetical protein